MLSGSGYTSLILVFVAFFGLVIASNLVALMADYCYRFLTAVQLRSKAKKKSKIKQDKKLNSTQWRELEGGSKIYY